MALAFPALERTERPRWNNRGVMATARKTTDSFIVSAVIPAAPERIYRAWLSGREHAKMTGGAATGSARAGGKFTAWDGYITGKNLELEEGRRIVQAWRTSEFPEDAPDSRLEVRLAPVKGGTKVTLAHSEIPKGQGTDYEGGWTEHYFSPMKEYFGKS